MWKHVCTIVSSSGKTVSGTTGESRCLRECITLWVRLWVCSQCGEEHLQNQRNNMLPRRRPVFFALFSHGRGQQMALTHSLRSSQHHWSSGKFIFLEMLHHPQVFAAAPLWGCEELQQAAHGVFLLSQLFFFFFF